jgi:hypothetical protein
MTTNNIDICGITPRCDLPKCDCNYPCNEICETHKFYVPDCKPDIENILQLFIDTSVEKCNVLNTLMGRKLVIYGELHIKILYVANTACQSVHSAHFDIPFCTFIMIGNISSEIAEVCLFIEDAFITQSDVKSFFVSTVILVCPLLEKKGKHSSCDYECEDNNYINKMKNKKFNYNKEKISCDTKTNTEKNINNDFYAEQDIYEDEDNSNFEFDIKYDMKCEDSINSSYTEEDEYFENDWK